MNSVPCNNGHGTQSGVKEKRLTCQAHARNSREQAWTKDADTGRAERDLFKDFSHNIRQTYSHRQAGIKNMNTVQRQAIKSREGILNAM